MGQSVSRKRPWLAALLAVLVTGLGHCYLRRWRRAVGWLAVLFAVATFLVDPAALEALTTLEPVDFVAVAPLLFVAVLSVFDAYFLARSHNASNRRTDARGTGAVAGEERTTCPNCGKELDPDIDFCQWCTTELDAVATGSDDGTGGDAS